MLVVLAAFASATAFPASAIGGDIVRIFAAASLREAMDEAGALWAAATGNRTVISYAGTSALARQIEQGAPADVFVSANVAWMEALSRAGLVVPGSVVDLLGNRLVLVAHGRDAATVEIRPGVDLAGRLGPDRLAMALVEAVPAGIYGREALVSLGLWGAVQDRIAQADNVRAALALVALGEAPLGIVYASDAVAEPGVSVIGVFPEESHTAIVYPAALVTDGDQAAGAAFLAFLQGAPADAVFERHGFTPPTGD